MSSLRGVALRKGYGQIALLSVVVLCGAPHLQCQSDGRWLIEYDKPSGWQIPKHKMPCKSENHGSLLTREVDLRLCGPGGSVELPKYYLDSTGVIHVYNFERYTQQLYELEYKGISYGYTGMMFGTQVASALNVSWIDEDGNGVYTRLLLRSPANNDVPDWVKKKAEQ